MGANRTGLLTPIAFAFRTPRNGIGDPAIDIGFTPTSTVNADPDLRGECALCDLAVDGGPGKASPVEDCFQADDTV